MAKSNRGLASSSFARTLKKWRMRLENNANDPDYVRKHIHPDPKGTALVVFFRDALFWKDDDELLQYHATRLEARLVCRTLMRMGYSVHAADHLRNNGLLAGEYDVAVVFGSMSTDYRATFEHVGKDCAKIAYCAVSNPLDVIEATHARRQALNARRGCSLPFPEKWARAGKVLDLIADADLSLLLATEEEKNDYPQCLRPKLRLIPAVIAPAKLAKSDEYVPAEREFLWLGGLNPVRKGVDLLLDLFAKHPEWTLNLIGPIAPPIDERFNPRHYELDFVEEYRRELFELPNIKTHGYLKTDSPEMAAILARCFCFVFPSCSEGVSPACVMNMANGLYPVMSKHSGVPLPGGCGRVLDACSIDEIETVLDEVHRMPADELTRQIRVSQAFATNTYTHQAFCDAVERHVREAVALKQGQLEKT